VECFGPLIGDYKHYPMKDYDNRMLGMVMCGSDDIFNKYDLCISHYFIFLSHF